MSAHATNEMEALDVFFIHSFLSLEICDELGSRDPGTNVIRTSGSKAITVVAEDV